MPRILYVAKLAVDKATGLPVNELKGQAVTIVRRGTVTPVTIWEDEAGTLVIPSSTLTVTDYVFIGSFYVDEADMPISALGGGIEVPLETTEGIAKRLDELEDELIEASTAAVTAADEVTLLRQWIDHGVTRRNIVRDPRTTNAASGLWAPARSELATVGGRLRMTQTDAGGVASVYHRPETSTGLTGRWAVSVGDYVHARAEVSNPGATSLWARLVFGAYIWTGSAWTNGTTGYSNPPYVEVLPGQTVVLEYSIRWNGTGTHLLPILWMAGTSGGAVAALGSALDSTNWNAGMSVSPPPSPLPSFNGSTPTIPGQANEWAGAPDASESVQLDMSSLTGSVPTLSSSPMQPTAAWYGTQAQYDALGTYVPTVIYNILTTP